MRVSALLALACLALPAPASAAEPKVDAFLCGPVLLKLGGAIGLMALDEKDPAKKREAAKWAYYADHRGRALDALAIRLDPAKSAAAWKSTTSMETISASDLACMALYDELKQRGRITEDDVKAAKAKARVSGFLHDYDKSDWP